MSTIDQVLKELRALSSGYIDGKPYIHIQRLMSLDIPKEEIEESLQYLGAEGKVDFHNAKMKVFRLTELGSKAT